MAGARRRTPERPQNGRGGAAVHSFDGHAASNSRVRRVRAPVPRPSPRMDAAQRRRRGHTRGPDEEDDPVFERDFLAGGGARQRHEARDVADDLAALNRYAFGGILLRDAMARVLERTDEAIEM